MTSHFAAVGQHRDDPDHLLLLGDDGRFYGLSLPDGAVAPTEPEAGDWEVDHGLPFDDGGAVEALVDHVFGAESGPKDVSG